MASSSRGCGGDWCRRTRSLFRTIRKACSWSPAQWVRRSHQNGRQTRIGKRVSRSRAKLVISPLYLLHTDCTDPAFSFCLAHILPCRFHLALTHCRRQTTRQPLSIRCWGPRTSTLLQGGRTWRRNWAQNECEGPPVGTNLEHTCVRCVGDCMGVCAQRITTIPPSHLSYKPHVY